MLMMASAAMAQRTDPPGSGSTGSEAKVTVGGSVFGGGNLANVGGNTSVTINQVGSEVGGDVYGGGALADVGTNTTNNTTVTLTNGKVLGDVYGGGLGDAATNTAAMVNGNVAVLVNGGVVSVGGSVFGCNNEKGSPLGTVTVTINGSSGSTGTGTSKVYAIGGVYGGGNLAHYDPTPGNYPTVTVNGCTTSIKDVYGGGNAAAVPYTSVTINGGDIDRVFAGGNGESGTPAHVGWKNIVAAPSTDSYGDGTALATIHGGTINQVFSGSNANGVIRETMGVSVSKVGSCAIHVVELYGGGNEAPSRPGTIAVGCMDENDMIDNLYGGANQANITGNILLNIETGRIGNVFGGNNTSGLISGTITVNIDKDDNADCASDWYIGNVYGGGNLAAYSAPSGNLSYPQVNILNGLVTTDVYGGGLGSSATVTGNPVVTINGGSVGNDVFGGGSEAAVIGATHVTVSSGSVGQDVYGGGALANTGATTVDIMGGTIYRDIYGGGLGDGSHAPAINGTVTVNIGDVVTWDTEHPGFTAETTGNATIGGSVYGCNNAAGSPQDNVTVNIYKTAHTPANEYGAVQVPGDDPTTYAIANVFGGGNAADFLVDGKTTNVNIYGCDNTIRRTFGGGNAAATKGVNTMIQGGRIYQVFGGGNGEVTAANINGNLNLNIHGGNVGQFYGASNQTGTITGSINVNVDNASPCPGNLTIDEFFCGGNFADINGNLETNIDCSGGMQVNNFYGGCNQADIHGHVILNLHGGTYTNVYGGSKGRLAGTDPQHPTAKSADIDEYVILNLYGGTIENVYGGSNVLGNIKGSITVNVIDEESSCPLFITNIYGGSNLTDYRPTNSTITSPVVNVIHAENDITGNVYGGSRGATESSTVTLVKSKPLVNIGYDAVSMSGYLSHPGTNASFYTVPTNRKTTIHGSVYGGGDAAKVEGNTEIHINKHAKVLNNVYGGGNMGEVEGNTKVIINGELE